MKNFSYYDKMKSIKNENSSSKIIYFLDLIEPYYVSSLIIIGIVGNSVAFFSRLRNKYK